MDFREPENQHIANKALALLEAAYPIIDGQKGEDKEKYVEYFRDKRGERQLGQLGDMVEKLKGKGGGRRRRRKSRRKSKRRRKKTKKKRRRR